MQRTETYKAQMPIEQCTQKALMLRIDDPYPAKKARPLVSDVIVIDGPAFTIACFMRSFAGSFSEVWSSALQITNMSSIPIPSIKNGIASEKSVAKKPM